MRKITIAILMLAVVTWLSYAQDVPLKFVPANIVKVAKHQETTKPKDDVTRYDVELKVGDAIHLVVLTPEAGSNTVEYAVGRNLMVAVKKKTMVVTDLLGRTQEVPILSSRKAVPSKAEN